jgi:hypothetical protein
MSPRMRNLLRQKPAEEEAASEKAPREADWSAQAADREVVITGDLIAFAGKVFDAGKVEDVVVIGDEPDEAEDDAAALEAALREAAS